MLKHSFRLYDDSCDGRIDADEFGKLLTGLHLRVSGPELLALLRRIDA